MFIVWMWDFIFLTVPIDPTNSICPTTSQEGTVNLHALLMAKTHYVINNEVQLSWPSLMENEAEFLSLFQYEAGNVWLSF